MNNDRKVNTVDLDYIIRFIKKNYLLVGVSVVCCLMVAYFVNLITNRVYRVSTSIVIHEESNGLAQASAQLLNEFGFISDQKSFANELLVLKSTPLVSSAIKNLDFQISYYKKTFFSRHELYKSSPFIVIPDKNYSQPIGVDFNVEIIDKNSFRIFVDKEDVQVYSFVTNTVIQEVGLQLDKVVEFDKYLFNDYMRFKILLNSSADFEDLIGNTYQFHINTADELIRTFKENLKVIPPDLESSIADISIETETPEKAIDFLNRLTEAYINSDLDKKRFTSIKTIEYINDQMNIIGDSLKRAEQNLQRFRSKNEVTNISLQSEQLFAEMRELERQKALLDVNTKYYEYVTNYFSKNEGYDELIAPSAMGINDPMLNNLIEELIRLNAEKVSFVENNQSKSPYLKKIVIRIENLRKMISENINYYEETNNIKKQDIEDRIGKLNGEIRKLPSTQIQLGGMERKFNVNDQIYTYLLEKRAEAEIAKASYQADTEIIEPAAIVGGVPVSPKKSLNYILAFLVGMIVPVGIIRFIELTRKSIVSLNEAELNIDLPIVGKIYHHDKNCDNIVEEYPKAHIAENFRHLHVGLKYFFKDKTCKTILISSSIGGEGKTFVAFNTALTLANTGYKTMIISFDLRKPKLSNILFHYNGNKDMSKVGLTEYISGQASMNEVIAKSKNPNLDFVLSGDKAPNPGELMASEKVGYLFDKMKSLYDYIIIDTAPIGLVSDAYNLMKYCDLTMLMLRMKRTPKNDFLVLQQDIIAKEINTCVLINDISNKSRNNYGYYEEHK